MRALVLLLLCVVLLAALQASYIVAEAKKHNGKGRDDDDDKRWKVQHNKKQNKDGKTEDITDVEAAAADHFPEEQQVANDVMVGDEPVRERVGKRENKKARKGKQTGDAQKEQKKQARAERQRLKQEKKAEKRARKDNKPARVACTSEEQCQTEECCVPNRNGELSCKKQRPRAAGKKCVTTCTCEGVLQCYAANTQSGSRNNRTLGKCIASPNPDLTMGSILTAASHAAPSP